MPEATPVTLQISANVVKDGSVRRVGLPGRLTKGAGTHLASWLQPSNAFSMPERQAILDSNCSSAKAIEKGTKALECIRNVHGRKCGHSRPISDAAYSVEILITKDTQSMRLWRASGDFALLRVVGGVKGRHVSVHSNGQFIVCGERSVAVDVGSASVNNQTTPTCFGPSGGSAFTAGKKAISVS